MSTLSPIVVGVWAVAEYNPGPGSPAFSNQRGFTSGGITRNGVGDVTLTLLDPLLVQGEGCIIATPQSNVARMVSAEPGPGSGPGGTNNQIRVRTFDAAGVAVDSNVFVCVLKYASFNPFTGAQ